jgi:ABC-type amino acid transport substrate-binding protein
MKSSSKIRALAAAATLLAGCATAWSDETETDALAAIRGKGTIEIAVYAEFPPYSFGKTAADAQGIDVDIARDIAKRLGLKLKLRMIAAGETVSDDLRNHVWKGHYMGGGVADVMLHVGYDPVFAGREKNVVLFEPYFHETVVVAYRPSRIPHLESPIALTEHKIAVEGDTISDHIMSSAYGGALRNSAVREKSLEDAVVAFKAGAVDGVMGPQGELQGLLTEQRVSDVMFHAQERVGQMRTAWDVGIAVKEGNGTGLRDAVAAALERLKSDGSLEKIFAAYGVKYIDAPSTAAEKKVARDASLSPTQPKE